jgi:hypothetical protein
MISPPCGMLLSSGVAAMIPALSAGPSLTIFSIITPLKFLGYPFARATSGSKLLPDMPRYG